MMALKPRHNGAAQWQPCRDPAGISGVEKKARVFTRRPANP